MPEQNGSADLKIQKIKDVGGNGEGAVVQPDPDLFHRDTAVNLRLEVSIYIML